MSPSVKPGVVPGPAGRSILSSLPPLSLYVHVPWCVRKCPYCDFNSHEFSGSVPETEYLEALAADLEQALPLIWGRQVISVFIGGGTPSLLSEAAVDRLLALLRSYLNLLPDAEITLEANPGTIEAGRFAQYALSGVNRVSLGIQSFNDQALKALGRIHDSQQARTAIEIAQKNFSRVNLDIMYALPGQTLQGCAADIEQALRFGTSHVSVYHLTLEPNTVFAKYPPAVPDDDLSAAMHEHILEQTALAGLEQYEVSAYARPGSACRHNRNYWEFGDYLGIGPGAHGKLSFHDRIVRQAKLRNPARWMQTAVARDGSHLAHDTPIVWHDLGFEFMLNALRLRAGVPRSGFTERTGQSALVIADAVRRATDKGLLDPDPGMYRATALGWKFLNDLQAEFLP